jgi:hypothetical protein
VPVDDRWWPQFPACSGTDVARIWSGPLCSARTSFGCPTEIITSFIPACGKCKWCTRGLQNLCGAGARTLIGDQPAGGFRMHAEGTGIATMSALGTVAEWQVYDEISLVKVDKSLPLNTICVVACGVQTGFGSATTAADVRPGDVVLVMGGGGVGMDAVQGASLSGASHVVVVDPAPSKKTWAPSVRRYRGLRQLRGSGRVHHVHHRRPGRGLGDRQHRRRQERAHRAGLRCHPQGRHGGRGRRQQRA